MNKKSIAIVGAGAWGTALAHLFATNGHKVFLWCYEDAVAHAINNDHVNHLFLKDVVLPTTIVASTDLQAVLRHDTALVIEAIPVAYLASVCARIDPVQALRYCWVLTSKGFSATTGMHAGQILQQAFGMQLEMIVLAGPSFASELVEKMPTACVGATQCASAFSVLHSYWKGPYTSLYFSSDCQGVLLCGGVKNVIALLLGLLDGAGYGKNTQAHLLTCAYKELKELVVLCGGHAETVDGLAGFGDLFLTASTNVSKNRTYGYLIGQKKSTEEISKQLPVLPEGVCAAAGLAVLIGQKSTNTTRFFLLSSVHAVLQASLSIDEVVQKIHEEMYTPLHVTKAD